MHNSLQSAAAASARLRTAERNYAIDNIRALLIFLVVLGHFYEININYEVEWIQYLIIYSFHMPAFAFLSGVCFKKDSDGEIYKSSLYPYLVSQILFTLFFFLCNGGAEPLIIQFTLPHWALWYMLAIFVWRMLANALSLEKRALRIALMISLISAVLAGFWDAIGYYLSLSRIIVFFPFFLLGIYIKQFYWDFIEKGFSAKTKAISFIIASAAAGLVFAFRNSIDPKCFYNSASYASTGSTPWFRLFNVCVALMIIQFLVIFAPNRKIPLITKVGQNTLSVYVVQTILIHYGPIPTVIAALPISFVCAPLLAAAFVVIISCSPINKIVLRLVTWPFKSK